jgi:hypothetical protein
LLAEVGRGCGIGSIQQEKTQCPNSSSSASISSRCTSTSSSRPNLEAACKKAISDDIDWGTQEIDCDGARATTITAVKIVPPAYEADRAHSLIIASKDPKGLPLDMLSLATFLYAEQPDAGPCLEIPVEFTEDE